ncbi:carbohydrate ABC transporter permease [Paenibacillus spongiae]|uniref:Sugar ABC transporter permease n=1 Tax=Paenibacillus spongiae TaxID=2909671 RepID=A0ABY5S5U5_9BACL|nr:sugar ABC transporter permease [Paenibacillus spongiae]UVI29074.1 sugar ABC transporter permease [Paenibacillus spongiae]
MLKLLRKRREMLTGYMFVLPWMIGFLLFMAYPIYFSLNMSFHKVIISSEGIKKDYVGWNNFKNAFLTDPKYTEELVVFIQSVVFMIPIIIVFSMLVALLINQPIRLKGFFRAIFFLPVVITSGQVVKELFSQGAASVPIVERYGMIEFIQNNLDPTWSEPIISIIQQLIVILWYSGVQILIFLAGLQKVNTQVYEAASIDGASPWEIFWKITLPSIKPFILVNIIYTTVDLFTNSLNDVIELIKVHMFQIDTGFGYATSLAWIYFMVIFVILLLVVVIFGRNDDYNPRKAGG